MPRISAFRPLTAALVDAFGDEAERRLRDGDDRARARLPATAPTWLARRWTGQRRRGDGTTARAHRQGARCAHGPGRDEVRSRRRPRRAVDSARAFGLDAGTIAALASKARRIPKSGESVDSDGIAWRRSATGHRGRRQRRQPRRLRALRQRHRAAAALCRERTSLLRVLAPRSWKSPGFEQSPQHPVVCVSWSDAQAYAHWLSQRTGHRYRLPTASEAHALPGTGGAKPVGRR